jgi:hypothetical protein
VFGLRVPVEYASLQAAVSISAYLVELHVDRITSASSCGPVYICEFCLVPVLPQLIIAQLTGEDSYQIAVMGVPGLRVEIVSDAPPPPDEPP